MTATCTTTTTTTTTNPVHEDSEEDESHNALMGKQEETPSEAARRHSRSWFDSNLGSKKSGERERDRPRKHRSTTSKQQSKDKSRPSVGGKKHHAIEAPRHRRQSASSTSSDEEDEHHRQDHRMVLAAARARLTSPSMVSQFTTRTNQTNKSSGSSGSNSTVTQASITKHSTALVKRPEPEEPPMSPAVPDAPDVFAYLEAESILDVAIESDSESDSGEEEHQDEPEEEEEEDEDEDPNRPSRPRNHSQNALALQSRASHDQEGSSSSSSSSFHGEDDFSSPHIDIDTDRSTSPERSEKDHESDHEHPATDAVSVKIANQMAAAQQRQTLHQLASPTMQRLNTSIPHTPTSMLTPRYPSYTAAETRPLSPGGLPVTGYELLATRLSTRSPDSEDGRIIKPMYRKFEALNHRVLLHLQDELSELEEHLQRLDRADTQARQTERSIIPASRRAAAREGGELQWHKTDVLGKIGYKLTQYNQALSSFNTTQSLSPPDPEDISAYRTYLQTENPIAEAETHFLDPTDDLVSVYSDNLNHRHPRSTHSPSYAPSTYSVDERPSIPSTFQSSSSTSLQMGVDPNNLPGIASALAVSVLVPILTFHVIDKFLGRLVVTLLVAVGMLGGLMQSGIMSRTAIFGREAITCAGIYGGVMIVMAGIL